MAFSEEQREDGIDTWVNDVFKQNDVVALTNQIGEFGGIFGDWYIYPQWLPDDEIDEGMPKSSQVKLSVIDPRYVFPQYNNKTGEMELCVIMLPYQHYVQKGTEFEIEERLYREIHTKETIFIQELDYENEVIEEREIDNPLNKILITHGIHQLKAGSFYGSGLIEDVIEGQKLFNEKTSDISDILDYHAAPITIIFGAKARQLEKGANKIWSGLPANAKVENLSSEGNIEAARTFLADVKTWMHELANIPENALGASREISNTSATALAIDFEPLIELAEDVRFYFDKGIKQVIELVIDIGIYLDEVSSDLKPPKLYNCEIEHGALLPRERSTDLADIGTERAMRVESRKGAMRRLGVKDIEAKLEEIDAEDEEEKKRNMELAEKYMDPAMISQIGDATNLNKGPNPYNKTDEGTPDEKKAKKISNKNPIVHGEQVVDDNKLKKG